MARKIKTHFLSPHGIHNGHSDTHWKGLTLCGVPCGGQFNFWQARRQQAKISGAQNRR